MPKWGWILFFTPSILLYNSSILKEVLGLVGLTIVIIGFLNKEPNKKGRLLILTGLIICLPFKPIWASFFLGSILVLKAIQIPELWLQSHGNNYNYRVSWSIGLPIPSVVLERLSDKQFDFINVAEVADLFLSNETHLYQLELSDSVHLEKVGLKYTPKTTINAQKNPLGKYGQFSPSRLVAHCDTFTLTYLMAPPASSFELTRINNNWSTLFGSIPEIIANVWFRPYLNENQSSLIKNWIFN